MSLPPTPTNPVESVRSAVTILAGSLWAAGDGPADIRRKVADDVARALEGRVDPDEEIRPAVVDGRDDYKLSAAAVVATALARFPCDLSDQRAQETLYAEAIWELNDRLAAWAVHAGGWRGKHR